MIHKYHAKRTLFDGRSFASKAEANRYAELKLLERAGQIYDLKCQVRYPLRVMGEMIATYVADFTYYVAELTYPEKGSAFVVEDVKGFATELYKLKRKLFSVLYPEVEFREITRTKRKDRCG